LTGVSLCRVSYILAKDHGAILVCVNVFDAIGDVSDGLKEVSIRRMELYGVGNIGTRGRHSHYVPVVNTQEFGKFLLQLRRDRATKQGDLRRDRDDADKLAQWLTILASGERKLNFVNDKPGETVLIPKAPAISTAVK
jgi:hypothetical protein